MMWDKLYNTEYAVVDNCLIMKFSYPAGKYCFSMPYTVSGDRLSATRKNLKYCIKNNMEYVVFDGNQSYIDEITATNEFKVEYQQVRNFQEYVYSSENLAKLSGKELHSKKNHVNKFKSLYNYQYIDLNSTMADICIKKTYEWMYSKYCGDIQKFQDEFISVKYTLENYDYFDLIGGAIFVENNLVAYTIGEKLTEDTALVHIEKADINYQGSYAIINNEFSTRLSQKYQYINREEDMGIEGLRKAKLSYKPVFMTDNYKCIITEV